MDMLSSPVTEDPEGPLSLGSTGRSNARGTHACSSKIRDSESMSTFPLTRTYSTTDDIPGDEEECCGETPRALVEGMNQENRFSFDPFEDREPNTPRQKQIISKSNISPLSPKTRLKKTPVCAKDRLAKKLRIRTK